LFVCVFIVCLLDSVCARFNFYENTIILVQLAV